MGTVTAAGKNIAVQALADACTHVAILNASGTEVSTARIAITKAGASGGVVALTNTPVIAMPAGSVAHFAAYFTALTGGTELTRDDLPTPETYAGAGTYTLDAGSITIADPA